MTNKPLNEFILKNFGLGEKITSTPKKKTNSESRVKESIQPPTASDPFQAQRNYEQKIKNLNQLSLHDTRFQEEMNNLLEFSAPERSSEAKEFKKKAHFPLRFTPNLKSKSKWQIRWHPKAAPLVKFAYQILYGSINPNHPAYNPKLREILQISKRCIVCRLSHKEWKHPNGIIVAGNQAGKCSAKVADTLVPQMATNVVNHAETFLTEPETILFLRNSPSATLPRRATTGSAAYDLFPLKNEIIPSNTRMLISTGLSCEMPSNIYGQVMSRSGMSLRHKIDVVPGVLDSDYRGIINVLFHNHSNKSYELDSKRAMAQILFLPLSQLPIQEAKELKPTSRGSGGFGSTDTTTLSANVHQLKTIAGRPPGTTFLGVQPSKATVRVNALNGHSTQIVVDSGSNITLVSSKLLDKLNPSPKPKEGQHIKINQVTGRSSTNHFVPLELFFETPKEPVSLKIEAYIVKDMNAPLILGNDFADQYSLSLLRENGSTSLKLGDSEHVIPLDSSVESSFLEVKALRAEVMAALHRKNYRIRNRLRKPNQVLVGKSLTVPPWSIRKISIRTTRPLEEDAIFVPCGKKARRYANATLFDSIITPQTQFIHVTNDTDLPISFQENDILGRPNSSDYYDTQPPKDTSSIQAFFNMVTSILRRKEESETKSEEQIYQDQQPDLDHGPKLAEVPDPTSILSSELTQVLDFNPRLSNPQKSRLIRVILRNHKAFSLDGRIGEYTDIKYSIKLKPEAIPVSMAPYHASPEKREDIDKQLDKWFSQGVIRDSESSWGAPVIVVYRNGKPRVCIDYRRVNDVTLADEYPLPRQTDILRALSGSQWLSTFDALSGFHQLEILEEHRHITAFRTHKHGLLEFTRLPFGLRNGPAVFQRVMNKVLAKFLWLFVLVYIDDIVVYSKSFEEHLKHLDDVLGAIAKANITLSPAKCHIGYQSLILLGQRVSRLGISTHKEKIDSVDAMKPPTKVKELQMFLGFVNYFANYIPFFTWITKPLYRLLSKDADWDWTPIHQEAYELCKLALKSAPILAHPIDGLGYRLYTDASDFGIGAVLQQVQAIKIKDLRGTLIYEKLRKHYDSGQPTPQLVIIADKDEERPTPKPWHSNFEETEVFIERVIAYWSRLLKSAEKNYSPTEKEALALKDALVKFQPLLEGEKITAITDHSALTWSKTYNNVNRRLMSWGLTFSAYPNLKIVHRAGRVHSNVDPLSRLDRRIPYHESPASNDPDIDLSQEKDIDFYGRMKRKFETRASALFSVLSTSSTIDIEIPLPIEHPLESISYSVSTKTETLVHVDPEDVQTILREYEEDPYFREILQQFPREPPYTHKVYHKNPDGLIFFNDHSGRDRLCIPASMRQRLMEEVHDSLTGTAHGGFERTYGRIANSFYWPRITKDIRKFVSTCAICQKIKHARHAPYGILQPIPIPNQPFEVVTMDFISELPPSHGYNAIFVLVCKLTKYAFFIPCSTRINEKKAAQLFFDKIVTHVGLPKQVISDRDTRWRNLFWKEVCESMGSRRALTTAHHPQADGQTEILNQTIEVAIRAFINKGRTNWASLLPYLAFAYNNTPHTATKYAPAYLLYGFHPRAPFNFMTNEPSVERPNLYEFNAPDAKQFVEDISSVRLDAKDALKLAQSRFENSYNKNHIPITFEPGDQVLVNIHSLELPESKGKGSKFARRFDGPFEVTERVTPVAYRIRLPHSYGIHPVLSIAHLEPYKSDDNFERKDLLRIRENPEEKEVEEIVDQKKEKYRNRYRIMYKCRWKDYGITERWIPESDLRNANEVLKAWKLKLKNRNLH
jgi:deoxyuridine 5'-triphosphate nucleotidohydrolase